MKTMLAFPGTFSPPTYGHVELATRVTEMHGNLTVICSKNDSKDESLFTPEDAVRLWHAYRIPKNLKVVTFEEFVNHLDRSVPITMVRGIRSTHDLEHERQVMILNHETFGIGSFLYQWASDEFKDISSSAAREYAKAADLMQLAHYTAPIVTSELLERALNLHRIFLVVGKPGAGKSTVLKEYARYSINAVHINTDEINAELAPLLRQHCGTDDLVALALERGSELRKIIGPPWLALLGEQIKAAPPGSDVFVEVAYGLQPEASMFRFVGGRVIFVDCASDDECRSRILTRGTPEHLPFVSRIPNLEESRRIAQEHKLLLSHVHTHDNVSSAVAALHDVVGGSYA